MRSKAMVKKIVIADSEKVTATKSAADDDEVI